MRWSRWRPFPNPDNGDFLSAPFGAGVYELRRGDTKELVLVGHGKNVAYRMTSLLPRPRGQGTRRNAEKRTYVALHLPNIQYRCRACPSDGEAQTLEARLLTRQKYIFRT